jgi:hypothetical protein
MGEGSQGVMRVNGVEDTSASMNIIRRETVLSKFPVHNLAGKADVNIQIVKRGENREVTLKWEVSYSSRYGPPRSLAYKLDTLYINRLIDKAGRPLPKQLYLGSLREIAKALDLGGDTNTLKNALMQNASAFISAKITYKGADSAVRKLDANFNRYSVILAGERLPDGRKADGVYIIFTEPFWEVLNNAPVRPLDYDYLKKLQPSAQRCYEIISYWMYAAIKYGNPHARIAYSDYCAFSAQTRYYEYDQVKKQMYKVHRQHKASGYLEGVEFEETTDCEGNPDWIMLYTPGPKARAEYKAFSVGGKDVTGGGAAEARGSREAVEELVQMLVTRGVLEKVARKRLAALPNTIFVKDQIEYVDHIIDTAEPGTFRNPPGFYVHMIFDNNVFVPLWFETSRRRKIREEVEEAARSASEDEEARIQAYGDYVRGEVEKVLCSLPDERRREMYESKRAELLEDNSYMRSWEAERLTDVVHSATLADLKARVRLASYEEFCDGQIPETVLEEPEEAGPRETVTAGGTVSLEPLRGEGAREEIARILREGSRGERGHD